MLWALGAFGWGLGPLWEQGSGEGRWLLLISQSRLWAVEDFGSPRVCLRALAMGPRAASDTR